MKTRMTILMLGALLLFAGIAGAANSDQILMNAATIPQFVEPLPLLEFEFINATDMTLPGLLAPLGPGLNGAPFPVNAEEFRSQILPQPNPALLWPPAGTCTGGTASFTYGYRSGSTAGIDPVTNIHTTYLGPVVIAKKGITARPTYGNNIPDPRVEPMGVVQTNLPIDMTLDWADPLGTTGPVGCLPDANGNYTNPDCGLLGQPYNGPMPIATHLHGGEVAPAFDGGPDAWFTQDIAGAVDALGNPVPDGMPDYSGAGWPGYEYTYPNNQQESTIWFHDHALGITRLNVYAGLAGIQPIIDPATPILTPLPKLTDGYDIPLIIQDRSFDTNCEIFYNLASNPQPNPTVHPFWIPEFIGDTIAVNGKTWPYLNVEPRQYRFRFVNGSNARFYELTIKSSDDPLSGYVGAKLPMLAIATDDGYLANAVSTNMLVIGPGERYEIVVDFKGLPANNIVTMFNSARTPYPGGAQPIKGLTDRVMQFRVNLPFNNAVPDTTVAAGSPLRDPVLNPILPIVTAHNPALGSITRQLTLNEVIGLGGPLELVVNNSKFNLPLATPGCNTPVCRETEMPAVGDTEIWEIINISADAHPMHTHLTSFHVLNRQPFKAAQYIAAYDALALANGVGPGEGPPNINYNVLNADGAIGGNPAIGPFLKGKARMPAAYEMGWKDTVIAYPGEVTRIAIRWAPTDQPVDLAQTDVGVNSYVGFNPMMLQGGVGYVWHCHIVDHEDNEMMRNYTVGIQRQTAF